MLLLNKYDYIFESKALKPFILCNSVYFKECTFFVYLYIKINTMTTITINIRSKAAKDFLEFAKNLSFVKIEETKILRKPIVKTNTLLKDFEIACKQLLDSKLKKTKRKTLNQLMDEK